MSDSTLNSFLASGTTTARNAFTPSPPTPAAGADLAYLWWDTTLNALYAWDGAAWQATGGGGGGGDLTLISRQTISVATPTITFSAIPGTYRDLLLSTTIRGTHNAASTELHVTFNGDTGANYDSFRNNTFGAAVTYGGTYMDVAAISAATSPANTPSQDEYVIANYVSTTFHKVITGNGGFKLANSGGGNINGEAITGYWRNTAAITQIDLNLTADNFEVGTDVALYGRGS